MGMHLVSWYESLVLATYTDKAINAVQDPSMFTSGDLIRVNQTFNQLAWAFFGAETDVASAVEIQAPSLRTRGGWNIVPINAGIQDDGYHVQNMALRSRLALDPNEGLEVHVDLTTTGTRDVYGLISLSDGNISPQEGNIITVRVTTSITLSAGSWVNGQMTFDRDLPVGNYQVVGMSAIGSGLTAARLVFPDNTGRPGVIGKSAATAEENGFMRYGSHGVLGEFDSTAPPTVDAIGKTGTSQIIYLDLIRV